MLRAWLPPILWNAGRNFKRRVLRSGDHFEYAPGGWSTPLPNGPEDYWRAFIEDERRELERLIAFMQSRPGRGLPADTDVQHLAYGYVLGLAGRHKDRLRILDYGGRLGRHFWIGQALIGEMAL